MHSITVGIVGFPNVGKSSIINSLKRSRVVSVKNLPGSTKNLQEIKIDKNITLIDSPGIVLETHQNIQKSLILSSIIDINQLDDNLIFIDKILKSISKSELMEQLEINDWENTIKINNNSMNEQSLEEKRNNFMKIFRNESNLNDFNTDSTMKFLYVVGEKYNKYKQKGIPDIVAASKLVIKMWNDGKIKWYVNPQQ